MKLFKKKNNNAIKALSELEMSGELFDRFISLQNEINVTHDTGVIAIATVDNDMLGAAFAKALALAYSYNNSPTLIIDANMYNPCLSQMLGDFNSLYYYDLQNRSNPALSGHKTTHINKNLDALCFEKQTYPANVFKSRVIQEYMKKDGIKYEHFIILVPSIKEHKEVDLLKDVLKSIVLVTQRDVTKKKDIYEAICFFRENELPLAKTVVIE